MSDKNVLLDSFGGAIEAYPMQCLMDTYTVTTTDVMLDIKLTFDNLFNASVKLLQGGIEVLFSNGQRFNICVTKVNLKD